MRTITERLSEVARFSELPGSQAALAGSVALALRKLWTIPGSSTKALPDLTVCGGLPSILNIADPSKT
jgi:hypothetical protein